MATTGDDDDNGQNNAPEFQGNGPELTKKSYCIAQMLHLTLGLVGKLKKSITKQTFPLHFFFWLFVETPTLSGAISGTHNNHVFHIRHISNVLYINNPQ